MNYEKMPFGKFKGTLISDLPTNYIAYALEEFELPDELNGKLKDEICERLYLFPQSNKSEKTFKDVFRKLAIKYHPDKGGSGVEMKVLNEFRDLYYIDIPF
jgi:hypothetical protein